MNRQLRSIYGSATKLRRKFFCCSKAIKNCLFRTFVSCLYGSTVWCMYRKSTFNRLRVGYNNAYRILFNLPRRTSMSTTLVRNNVPTFHQARRQESVTGGEGGGRNKFWEGGTRSWFMWIWEGHGGTRNLFQCGSNEQGLQFKNFYKFWLSSQNSSDFSRILRWRLPPPKKRSSSQKFYEILCESTKITKIWVVNTNLGVSDLDLQSNSPEPVNISAAQSSLRGAQFSFGGHK